MRGEPPPRDQPVGLEGDDHESPSKPARNEQWRAIAQSAIAKLQTLRSQTTSAISRRIAQHPRAFRLAAVGAGIAGVLFLLVSLFAPKTAVPPQVAPDTRRFFVSTRPVLVFAHTIGSVHVVSGSDDQVTIKEIDNGIVDAITAHYDQRADTVTVTVDIQDGLMQDTWVDFEVAVPRSSGFSVAVPAGTLDATGLDGKIALSGTTGSIWATDLTGDISLTTQGGSINLTNVRGQVNATTENGTITTTATKLDGHSTLRANGGTINFHGSLSPTSAALFENTNGAVGVTLPQDAAFSLSATATGGSINCNFTHLSVSQRNGRTEAHGGVGAGRRAQLTVRTGAGSIGINKGS
jgi:hypothetical protein